LVLAKLRALFARTRNREEFDDEMHLHLELEIEHQLARGLSPAEARRAALLAFGGIQRFREETREARGLVIVDDVWQDVRLALRRLRRSPGVSATVAITLGLGIGANAAVFATLDEVFFRPPSGVADPASLRRLYSNRISAEAPENGPEGTIMPVVATRDLLDFSRAAHGIAQIEADYLDYGENFADGSRARLTFVSPGYFNMLGVRLERGRAFAPEESHLPGPVAPAAIISDALWRSKYGSDPDILGKSIQVDDINYPIIGVAAPAFQGMELHSVDLWVPLGNVANGDIVSLRAIARLEHGADARLLEDRLTRQYRESHRGDRVIGDSSRIIVAPLNVARGPELTNTNAIRIIGMPERSISLLLHLPIVGVIVLLIAIANVASLLLMRAFRRQRETAVRLALGISPARLVIQQVIESLLLAILAGGVGLAFAAMTGGVLRAQLGPGVRWTTSVVDVRVAIFTVVIACVAGVLASVAPTVISLRRDVASSLRPLSAAMSRTGMRLRSALLATQAALCVALVASAGAFLQSLHRAGTADRGFDVDRTLLVSVPAGYGTSETDLARIRDAIRRLPSVETVGRSFTGIAGIGMRTKVGLSGSDTVGINPHGPWVDFVGPEWGRALGVRMIGGHMLDSSHVFGPYAVVNEALARVLFHGKNAAGTCVWIREPQPMCRAVVGIVRDIQWNLGSESLQRIYVPIEQAWSRPSVALIPNYLVVRTKSPATPTDVRQIRTLIAPLSPDPSRTLARRVIDILEPELQPWRLATILFLSLGFLGLLAAAAGTYGLVLYDVNQRTRELGVRIALGAPRASILLLVLRSGLRTVAIGAGIGVWVALMTGQAMASLLYATAPYDPAVLVGTALTLVIVTTCASLVPAWKATRLNPTEALSAE
jgi:predicted permease